MLRDVIRVLGLSAILFAVSACGGPQRYVVTGTERAAGADGEVVIEKIEGSRMVTVNVENLPPPDRITAGATVYVVWIKPQGAAPTMAGLLEYNASNRKGRMRATTPHQRFTVMVTAEVDGTVASPSEIIVLRQEVEGRN
ncbi:MAG: anti-sigma factor [Myxococcales bacterium]|nr:anti-sigma factor [Myxococcales bacterium]